MIPHLFHIQIHVCILLPALRCRASITLVVLIYSNNSVNHIIIIYKHFFNYCFVYDMLFPAVSIVYIPTALLMLTNLITLLAGKTIMKMGPDPKEPHKKSHASAPCRHMELSYYSILTSTYSIPSLMMSWSLSTFSITVP